MKAKAKMKRTITIPQPRKPNPKRNRKTKPKTRGGLSEKRILTMKPAQKEALNSNSDRKSKEIPTENTSIAKTTTNTRSH